MKQNNFENFDRIVDLFMGDSFYAKGVNFDFAGSVLDWDFNEFKELFCRTADQIYYQSEGGTVHFVYHLDRENYVEFNFCSSEKYKGYSWVMKKGNETLAEKSYGSETETSAFFEAVPKLDYFLGLI